MADWRTLGIGDRVSYRWNDPDGSGVLNCYISSTHEDHAIAMDYDAARYWVDDDTQHMFEKGWV